MTETFFKQLIKFIVIILLHLYSYIPLFVIGFIRKMTYAITVIALQVGQ